MKKIVVIALVVIFSATLLPAAPASASHGNFWGGLAVGLGSAFLLGGLFYPPRAYYYPRTYYYPPPAYYYPPPAYYYNPQPYYYTPPPYYYTPPTYYYAPPSGQIGYPPPPPPEYKDNWVPGHWEERPGSYGESERIWVPGYWKDRQ